MTRRPLSLVPQFTQLKSDGEVRWAVLNVVTLLRRHERLHDQLTAAMLSGSSIGDCILLVESQLQDPDSI